MLDVNKKILELRQTGLIKGSRPVIIKILKGNHSYSGKYLLTIGEDSLHFQHLSFTYNFKGRNAKNFKIPFDSLNGYRFAFEKVCYKRITLIFKDDLEFAFIFPCDCIEAGNNEKNANEVMKKLKEEKIYQKNNLKGGKRGQRTISTRDQLFVKEVRSPSKKTGFFG